jgi:hypothetical protein
VLSRKEDVSEKGAEKAVAGKRIGLKLLESDYVCGIDRLHEVDGVVAAFQDHLCTVI